MDVVCPAVNGGCPEDPNECIRNDEIEERRDSEDLDRALRDIGDEIRRSNRSGGVR